MAALEKVGKCRTTPGSASELLVNATLSVPKNRASTVAAAAPNVLCPEMFSGNGGVTMNGCHVGSGAVAGLPSLAPAWMAVTGRQKS